MYNEGEMIAAFILLLLLDLLTAMVRAALTHTHVPRLLEQQKESPHSLERTLALLGRPALRSSLRAWAVLLHVLLAFSAWRLFSPAFQQGWQSWALALGLGVFILLLEYLMENPAHRDPEGWAVRLTPPGALLEMLLRPLVWLLGLLNPAPRGARSAMGSVTEDDLKDWVEADESEGLEKGERKMIYSIFHFSDTLCREIMVPRMDVSALEADTPLPDAIQQIILSGHSRLPVYDDEIDNVVGILYAKDLLQCARDSGAAVRDVMRQAYFVPEAKRVDDLLKEMQARGVHIVLVVDEYGGMAGLVTLEDIMEEIVGEIRDEYDQAEELPYQQVSENEYLFQGRTDIDDFNEVVDTHLTREAADTLGGFIYSELGRVPAEGEGVDVEGWRLSVEQVIGRRIRLVRARRTLPVEETPEPGE